MDIRDLFQCATILIILTACASQPKKSQTRTLSDLAPATMAPPNYDDANPTVDPLYVRSQADYHYTLAEAYSFDGKTQKAIEEFKLTLVYDSTSAQVRMRLTAEYVRAGMMTEAVEQAEAVVEASPNSVDARILLGGLYSTLKVYEKANAQYDAILQIDPKNLEAPVYKAALLAEQKKFDEAIAMFHAVAERKDNPNRHQAYYYEGRILVEKGADFDAKAIAAFQQSIAAKPGWVEPVLALSQVYKSQEKFETMLKLMRSFQEKFGPNREIAKDLSQYYLEKEKFDEALEQLEVLESFERDNLNVKVKIALILIERKDYEKAAVRLEEVLQDAPDSDKIRFYLGAVYEELEKPDKALTHYAQVPPSSTYFADAVIHQGFLLKAHSLHDAQKALEKALAQRQDLPQLYAFYASVLDEEKQYAPALKMLAGAVERFPAHAQLRFYLGTMYDRLGNSSKSIEEMKTVLTLEENHVQAMNFLAFTYAEQGRDLDQAELLARKALDLQPRDGFILDTVGWVLFKKGHYDEAVQYLEQAYMQKSSESIIAEHLGDVYYRLQLVDKAKKMYHRAAETEQDEKKLREIRSKSAAVDHQVQSPLRTPASEP